MTTQNIISDDFKKLLEAKFDPIAVRASLAEKRQGLLNAVKDTLEEFEKHANSGQPTFGIDENLNRPYHKGANFLEQFLPEELDKLNKVQKAIASLDNARFSYDGICIKPEPIVMNPTNDLEDEVLKAMEKEPTLNSFYHGLGLARHNSLG